MSEAENMVEPHKNIVTLRGGPWAWCWKCGDSGALVKAVYRKRKERWECEGCGTPVKIYECPECKFQGGDATQLPEGKRPWGFVVMVTPEGHKAKCPRCGSLLSFQVVTMVFGGL